MNEKNVPYISNQDIHEKINKKMNKFILKKSSWYTNESTMFLKKKMNFFTKQ